MMLLSLLLRRGPVASGPRTPARGRPIDRTRPGQPYLLTRAELEARRAARARLIAGRRVPGAQS